jgi:hypothetical protein
MSAVIVTGAAVAYAGGGPVIVGTAGTAGGAGNRPKIGLLNGGFRNREVRHRLFGDASMKAAGAPRGLHVRV